MDQEAAPAAPDGYNDANRAFIQAFMARGTLTFEEAQKILAEITAILDGAGESVDPQSITMEVFTSFTKMAREAIEPMDFDIRMTRDQVRGGQRVWVFMNAHSDAPTQLATTRTPEEVAYIKRLLDAMFNDYNTPRMEVMAVDEGQALKVSRPSRSRESLANGSGEDAGTAADKGLKHSEVLALLSSLVAEGWLEKSRQGFYSLSPRALVELWSWLVETYNDEDDDWLHIKFCEACKEVVTYGQRCNEPSCSIRLHDFCEDGYWRTQREKKCPKCSTPWGGNHFVGERAVTSRTAYQRGRPKKNTARRRRSGVEEAGDGDEMDDEE
ncbi:Nse1 non-SMC component of SMC5-6 complex-domain-containing protein [Immersiella caudata]|uniref:Non-structural maintenance of chromosomes element 1 homolog n=1 Tax=Immersiella caudata TaxID=314043 RepID=A0AA39X5N0_9PEZI|nr:Nse1 non-SMC component of SMC5-6 complex-domain-containing protein [Immersiella caudata]